MVSASASSTQMSTALWRFCALSRHSGREVKNPIREKNPKTGTPGTQTIPTLGPTYTNRTYFGALWSTMERAFCLDNVATGAQNKQYVAPFASTSTAAPRFSSPGPRISLLRKPCTTMFFEFVDMKGGGPYTSTLDEGPPLQYFGGGGV